MYLSETPAAAGGKSGTGFTTGRYLCGDVTCMYDSGICACTLDEIFSFLGPMAVGNARRNCFGPDEKICGICACQVISSSSSSWQAQMPHPDEC
jgi:hypothetical protein